MRAPFQQWKANRNQDRKHPMMRRIIHDLTHALWGVSLANAAGAGNGATVTVYLSFTDGYGDGLLPSGNYAVAVRH